MSLALLAVLRVIWPYLAAAGVIGGAWLWQMSVVSSADKAGYKRALTEWQASDKIAVAVGNETTALLKRNAAAQEGKLNDRLAKLAQSNVASAVESRSLRDRLTSIAATPPSRPASSPACRSYEAEYRSCAGLLGEGVELAGAGSSLVSSTSAQLTGLQEWAGIVQAVNK